MYLKFYVYSDREKPIVVKSGERASRTINLPMPIHLFPIFPTKYEITGTNQCGEIRSAGMFLIQEFFVFRVSSNKVELF